MELSDLNKSCSYFNLWCSSENQKSLAPSVQELQNCYNKPISGQLRPINGPNNFGTSSQSKVYSSKVTIQQESAFY